MQGKILTGWQSVLPICVLICGGNLPHNHVKILPKENRSKDNSEKYKNNKMQRQTSRLKK